MPVGPRPAAALVALDERLTTAALLDAVNRDLRSGWFGSDATPAAVVRWVEENRGDDELLGSRPTGAQTGALHTALRRGEAAPLAPARRAPT
jgi:hypothetical protein